MALAGSRLSYPLSACSSSCSGSEASTVLSGSHRRLPTHQTPSRLYLPVLKNDLNDDDSDAISSTSSASTDHLPALTRGCSIASSECSAMQTDIASAVQNGYVLESDDGVLTLPSSLHEPDADLLCPFQILDCDLVFASVRHFKTHVFSHFRSHHLPTTALCFLCDRKFEQTAEDDPALAWNDMLSHMAHEHFRCGQEFGTMRADFGLMRWMYDRKIISDVHFKRAQICPAPVLLPMAASRRASQILSEYPAMLEAPEAPSPGAAGSVSTEPSLSMRRLSAYNNQTYFTVASPRAERRRRDSMRPMIRPATMTA